MNQVLFDMVTPTLTVEELLDLKDTTEQARDAQPRVSEIDALIAALQAERQALTRDYNEQLAGIETCIKERVLLLGHTVKGSTYMAVWNKGRETWEGKLLDGYAIAHPEVLACRKVGEPTVSFRKIMKGKE